MKKSITMTIDDLRKIIAEEVQKATADLRAELARANNMIGALHDTMEDHEAHLGQLREKCEELEDAISEQPNSDEIHGYVDDAIDEALRGYVCEDDLDSILQDLGYITQSELENARIMF